jgi:hypothetical protein
MYSIYYFCFLLTLILALIFNYYISSEDDIKIPGLTMINPIPEVNPSSEPVVNPSSEPVVNPPSSRPVGNSEVEL